MTSAKSPPNNVLVAHGVTWSYRSGRHERTVLNGIDLSVSAGELVAVTGPSGSGKTTLLHCLSGILLPDAGTVTVAGTEVTSLPEGQRADLRARTMGFVFQRLNLLPALTVAENVELPLVMAGRPRDEVLSRAAASLEAVGLGDRGGDAPHDLSGGEAQRVAIARAVVGRPAIVFADEPTGALDQQTARTVVSELAGLAERGAAVLLATHDDAVAATAHRWLRLRDGGLSA